ncbi:MAG: HDOD domain-containing protein [Nibricoccus sp.]
MPHVLILDDSDVARLALRGMLNEQGVRYSFAATCAEAWATLHRLPDISLVIVEVKLKSESAVPFLQRMRANAMFRPIPVLIYSSSRDVAVVRSVLSFKPQNYLLKPYRAELVEHELEKAFQSMAVPAPGEIPSEIREKHAALAEGLDELLALIPSVSDAATALRLLPKIKVLSEASDGIGNFRIEQFLRELVDETSAEHWWYLKDVSATIECIAGILTGKSGVSSAEKEKPEGNDATPRDLALWTAAEANGGFPLELAATQAEIDGLPGFPVIDTMSAAFTMTAEGSQSSLAHLNDLVAKDASLSVSVLIAANHLAREGDLNAIEAPALGVSMLGEVKLVALARKMPCVSERVVGTEHFNWGQYHRFQIAVGRMCEFIRRAVEFKELESIAYTAGLIHDVGQLALMRVYPHGFRRMTDYAAVNHLSLAAAQEYFLGTTAARAVTHYVIKHGLPSVYCSVIEHWRNPAAAPALHIDIVAIVSLARFLCEQAGIGRSGDFADFDHAESLESTMGWGVLRERVFPSFNPRTFQSQAASFGRQLREKLNSEDYQERSKPLLHSTL